MSILSIYLIGCLVSFVFLVLALVFAGEPITEKIRIYRLKDFLVFLLSVLMSWCGFLFLVASLLLVCIDWDKKPFGDD